MEVVTAIGATALAGTETIGTALTSMLGVNAPMNLAAGSSVAGTAGGLGSTALSVLQGAAGLGAALSAIGQGDQMAASQRMQAIQADAEGRQEELAGMQRTTALKRELAKAIGQSDVVYAAGGTDIGGGVAADARGSAASRAATEITVDRSVMDARVALHNARAAGFRRLASQAESAGWLGGGTKLAGTAFDLLKRG